MKVLYLVIASLFIGSVALAFALTLSSKEQLSLQVFLAEFFSSLGGEVIGAVAVFLLMEWKLKKIDAESTKKSQKIDLCKKIVSLLKTNSRDLQIEAISLARSTGILFDGSFEGVNLQGVSLREHQLDGSNFRGCCLAGVDFFGSSLNAANLQGADLTNANLQNVSLSWANLYQAKVSHSQLEKSSVLWKAILPSGQEFERG
ncbi:pentapeptide repeat-containing protein [Pseudoalteromonas sp. XMcav11-Q]|uniref:pentapeptide repeat-containing protein n=1 Tax=Pseudoalteromonas sp. XMcav11-Q TaxID=3136665 RepID=UPI0032C46166